MKTDALYRLSSQDAPQLIPLLTECFEQDPLYHVLIPDKALRDKILPEIFSCDVEELFENCQVFADSPEINGIIVVSDETEPYDPIRYYATEAFYQLKTDAFLIKDDLSLRTLWNFIKGKSYLNSSWTHGLHQDNRLHIIYFAVRPAMQGHGIADKLMNGVIDYADEKGLLISLETHNRSNVEMYQHFGFDIYKTERRNFDLAQYCMVRHPKGSR